MERKPKWSKWRQVPTYALWEAVSLSLDIEPSTVRNSSNCGYPASGFRVTRDFRDRAEILERIVHDGFSDASGLVLQRRYPAELASTILPADFVRFAKLRDWPIPPELVDAAEHSQRSTQAASDGSQSNSGATAGRWPWGGYETELLRCLDAAARRYWVNYDPTDPTTARTNDVVADWLQKEFKLSQNKAQAIATILRADDLPAGPRR